MSRHPDPNTHCTPMADWPDLDKALWAHALEPGDLLDTSTGYALRWKASTRIGIENGYGRWLGWLARSGLLDEVSPPGARVTLERMRQYRDMLYASGNSDNSVAGRLQQLCNVLRAIEPSGDWSWIHLASTRIAGRAVMVRDPARRIQPAKDVLQLGDDLMAAAEADRFRQPSDRATLFRDGLMVSFLIYRPFRVGNLQSIALERHLLKRGGQWRLFIDSDQTKSGETIECSWPHELTERLERYLAVHRPQLLKGAGGKIAPTDALWISRQGKAMGIAAISVQIAARTKETFGRSINPHTFRHIAATTIASANPEGVADIRAVLGHRTSTAAEKYYNRAEMIGASALFNDTVADLRKAAARRQMRSA